MLVQLDTPSPARVLLQAGSVTTPSTQPAFRVFFPLFFNLQLKIILDKRPL